MTEEDTVATVVVAWKQRYQLFNWWWNQPKLTNAKRRVARKGVDPSVLYTGSSRIDRIIGAMSVSSSSPSKCVFMVFITFSGKSRHWVTMLKVDLQKNLDQNYSGTISDKRSYIELGSLSSQKSNRSTVVVRLARANRVAGWRTIGVSRDRWRGESEKLSVQRSCRWILLLEELDVVERLRWGKVLANGWGLRFDYDKEKISDCEGITVLTSSLEFEEVEGVGVAHLLIETSRAEQH